ncbi:hypothetical protein TcWFU_008831 [Taenia crassiceps]|uniref:Uncharacterized protein n=1 Tax=Taenia crassiceps TaxID=6207 RepID=A0ABR4QIJ1_9CEST
MLEKLCEKRVEEFKRYQVREYNIRWRLRLRQLENFRKFRLLTPSRLFPGLTCSTRRSASPLLHVQPPSSPPLSPTPPLLPSLSARRAIRSRSASPCHLPLSRNRRWPGSLMHRWQRPLKHHCLVNADGLLTASGAPFQLSKRELETIIAWEKEECERLKKVMTFRMSVEEEARNQTMKPFYELLSVLNDRSGEVSQDISFLNNTKSNPLAFGKATFKSNASSTLEHLQQLMAVSSGGYRSSIIYLPRFHTLNSSKTALHRNRRISEGFLYPLEHPRATPPSNRGHIDEFSRPLSERTLGSLGRQLKRLESRAIEKFYRCLEQRSTLLGGRDAILPRAMIRAAEWRQEMLGLELWTSRLSTNCDFSYFELCPLVCQQKRKEEIEDLEKRKEGNTEEKDANSESELDYCN